MLGDAIHPMSPAGGVGAVTALNDAAMLAHVISEKEGFVTVQSVAEYEQKTRNFARCLSTQEFHSKRTNVERTIRTRLHTCTVVIVSESIVLR